MSGKKPKRSTKQAMQGVPTRGTLISSQPLAALSAEEARTWIEGMRTRLLAKQKRERAYLDRRAQRGTHTPTDDAYEADQQLEDELVALLAEVLVWFDERQGGA